MWLCISSRAQFEESLEKTHWRKIKQMQPVWFCILWCKQFEDAFENTQWRKNQTNATSVTLHPLMQAIWGSVWKHIVEKNQTNATSVTLHPLMQVIWGRKNAHWRKVKQVQPVRLCMLWSKFFWRRGVAALRGIGDRRQIKQKFAGTCIIDHRYKWNQWFTRQHHHDPLEGCGCSGEPHFPASETGTATGKVAGLWCSPHHQSGGPAHSPLSQFQPLHSCARPKWFERTHEKTQRN